MKHKDFFPLLTEFLGLWHTFKPLQFILFALTVLRACCVVLRSLTASSDACSGFSVRLRHCLLLYWFTAWLRHIAKASFR